MCAAKLVKKTLLAGAAAIGVGAWAVAPRSVSSRAKYVQTAFPDLPFAHRGLHDAGSGLPASGELSPEAAEYVQLARSMAAKAGFDPGAGADTRASDSVAPENSLAAFAAACEAGYGIELDVQLTSDGQVVVIHDGTLQRVCGDPRSIREVTYEQLTHIPLFPRHSEGSEDGNLEVHAEADLRVSSDGDFQHVPLLSDVLALVDGRVPLIVEYKMGERLDKELMVKTDTLLNAYNGWYCVESFNPEAVNWYRRNRPEVIRGQLATPSSKRLRDVRSLDDFGRWGAGNLLMNWAGRPDFVAYEWHGGSRLPMKLSRALGATTVAWTIRSSEDHVESLRSFDHIIFESFVPDWD
ncbi:MAG: glycerophosphodiester phosphodiesterase [Bifidobacteriaceae bacterium]|jgi:glycerophosphoryl diester phosphodiesterase|nr:glycerophosphodiester phosphodiesterase [Bifidobacteriaceae bacterium]MCI1978676.1 glycerophosphodiester phosphodiesterase [Bifidobacteriaceae bacterium]